MRTLSPGLLAAQRAGGVPNIPLTVGGVNYASRLKQLLHIERPFGGRATIILDNHDKGITTDLRGKEVNISYGFSGQGSSQAAPLWVLTMRDMSYMGELAVQLDCIDMWLKLSLAKIVAGGGTELKGTIEGMFLPGWYVTGQTSGATGMVTYVGEGYVAVGSVVDTFEVGEVVQCDLYPTIEITVSSLSDFGGGSAPAWDGNKTYFEIIQQLTAGLVDVVLDSSDGCVDIYPPIYETITGTPILDIIQDLLDDTYSGARMGNDGKLHIFDMTNPPGSPHYSYDTDHVFYTDLRDTSSILPNRIYVLSVEQGILGVAAYRGMAIDTVAYNRFGMYADSITTARVYSDGEADRMAACRISRVQKEATRGTIEVPMNCGQELLDYIRVTDTRADIDYYGWVGSIEHRWQPGLYRAIIGLGGLTGGERIAPEEQYPLPNIPKPIVPPVILSPWTIPAAVQGYHHNITFTAVDWNTVSWGSGTIKFYDGTTQAVSSGSYNLPNGLVHHIYFDLNDASPNVLKVTSNYLNVLSTKTGVLCLIQRGSDVTVKATVIPSYGKEPLITADVIYLTGLLDKLPDGTYGKLLSTVISAGRIKLDEVEQGTYGLVKSTYISAGRIELWEAVGDLDDIGEGGTYGKVRRTDISAGHIKLYIDQNLDDQGIEIASDAGKHVKIDSSGITIIGEFLRFKYGATLVGYLKALNSYETQLYSRGRITLMTGGLGTLPGIHLDAETYFYQALIPRYSTSYIGASGDRVRRIYGTPILDRVGVSVEGAFKHRTYGDQWVSTFSDNAWRDNG